MARGREVRYGNKEIVLAIIFRGQDSTGVFSA